MDELEVWQAHRVELIRYATLLVGPNDAADVVSVAFAKVMRTDRADVRDTRAYLMRAVAHTAFDQRRSTKRRQVRELHAVLPQTASFAEPAFDIHGAVASLSVQQRAVVYFTYWEDLDSAQISQLLHVSPATVRRHLIRARNHLRKVLQ